MCLLVLWAWAAPFVLMLSVGDAGGQPHNIHLAPPPHTTSTLSFLTKALTEEEVEEGALLTEEEEVVEEGALLTEEEVVEEGALLTEEEEVDEGALLTEEEEEVEEGALLTEEEVVEEGALLTEEEVEEGALLTEVVVVVEKVVVMERNVLERIKRETPLEDARPGGHGDQATLYMKEMFVVHESQWGRLLMVVSLGVCIGLLGGVLLILTGACCYLKCSPGRGLDLGQKHSTYRSADVIDEVL